MTKRCVMAAVVLPLVAMSASKERILYFEEFDRYADRTAVFNEAAGAQMCEPVEGNGALRFAAKEDADFRKDWFPFFESPKANAWKLSFDFTYENGDAPWDFAVKLAFGSLANPEVRVLHVCESGCWFEPGPAPRPAQGALGFLPVREINRAVITVENGKARFWVRRGGVRCIEGETEFPAKPLVGWNLWMSGGHADCAVRFDRLVLTDGSAAPHEHGDLCELLDELKVAPRDVWDPAFGEDFVRKGPKDNRFWIDFEDDKLVARMRSKFLPPASGKGDGTMRLCLVDAVGKVRQIWFAPCDQTVNLDYRRLSGGAYSNAFEKAVLPREYLRVAGDVAVLDREVVFARPPMGRNMRYLQDSIQELYVRRDDLPTLADRVWEFEVVKMPDGKYRVILDRNVLCELKPDVPFVAAYAQGTGLEARAQRQRAGWAQNPAKWTLPVPKDGFRLERVRENLGTFALECNGYLSRNGFDAMPSSCLFNVPRRQWIRAKAVCQIDPHAPADAVPVITARLSHFFRNGGRSIAMCQKTVDLREPSPSVVRKGDWYSVTFDFDIGSIQDLTSMTDGLAHCELPYLNFEFTGPLWEKNRFYIDRGRSPASMSVSSVIVRSGELLETPVRFTAVAARPYSLYYPDETPGAHLTVDPVEKGAYVVSTIVTDEEDREIERQSFEVTGRTEKDIRFKATGTGLYKVVYSVSDRQGTPIVSHRATFGRIPADDRRDGYDSKFYSWNFRGAHGTPNRIEDWMETYHRLGVHRTLLGNDFKGGQRELVETNALCLKYGITQAQFPNSPPKGRFEQQQSEEEYFADMVPRMRKMVELYPHCRTALIFHESGTGPFPKELYGEKTEIPDYEHKRDLERVMTATKVAKAWRQVDPGIKLVVGNSDCTIGLMAQLFRGGFPKEYLDAMGEESVGMTIPPEMSTAYYPWCLKRLAEIYGYPPRMDCPYEWKCRTERYDRYGSGVTIRDALIGFGLGYTMIPISCGTETANSYADTIWCSGTFDRWPLAYPRHHALGFATLTWILDGARYVRQLKTGSLTAYALEFETRRGWVYAVWTARGELEAVPAFENLLGVFPRSPSYTYVTMTGRTTAGKTGAFAVSEQPAYLVSDVRLRSIDAAGGRRYRQEWTPEKLGRNKIAAPLVSADEVVASNVRDIRVEIPFDSDPRRPGRFAVRSAVDDEKGPCVEVEHLSQEECPEIMTEYVTLKLKDPKPVDGRFDTIGLWAKGNSNWGRVFLEFEDAEGETWFSCGMGGVGCNVYDWAGRMAFNFEGWNFLEFPLTDRSDVIVNSPGDNEWQWTRDGRGNGRIDFPIKVTGVVVSQYGRTLNLFEMEKGSPVVRLKDVSVRAR